MKYLMGFSKGYPLLLWLLLLFSVLVLWEISAGEKVLSGQPALVQSSLSAPPISTQQWLKAQGACHGKRVAFFKETAASVDRVRPLPEHVINRSAPGIASYTFCRCITDAEGVVQADDYNFSTLETVLLKNGHAFAVSNSGWESVWLTYSFYFPDSLASCDDLNYWYKETSARLREIQSLSRSYPQNSNGLTPFQEKQYGSEGLAHTVAADTSKALQTAGPLPYGEDIFVGEMESFHIASVEPTTTKKDRGRTVIFSYRYGPL